MQAEGQARIEDSKQAKTGLTVFLLGIATVVFVAMFGKPLDLLPKGVGMSVAIQLSHASSRRRYLTDHQSRAKKNRPQ